MGVYKRGKIWYIDYYFKGSRIRERVGKNRRKADKMLSVRQAEILQGRFNLQRVRPTPYFQEFAREYLQYSEQVHRACNSFFRPSIKRLLEFFKGKRIGQVDTWLIRQFISKRKEEVSNASINRDLSVLSSIFSLAIKYGKLTEHPMKAGKVKPLKEEIKPKSILSEEEEERLLSVTRDWFKDMLIMALDTGMSQIDLVKLKWENINLKKELISFKRSKTGNDVFIPTTPRVLDLLKKRIEKDDGNEHVFPQSKGERPWRIRSAFVRACSKANIDGLRFHDLRHTFATRISTRGADIATLQKLGGWKDHRMVMRYTHPALEDMRRAIQLLSQSVEDSHKMDTTKEKGLKVISLTP